MIYITALGLPRSDDSFMDMLVLYKSMAERWQSASNEATHAALRVCYAQRAQRYLELAANQTHRSVRNEKPAENA